MAQQEFHLTASGTWVLQSAGGATLDSVIVNTGQTGATVTVYDNTTSSGTEIAAISAAAPGTFPYNVPLKTGLTVVIAGATPPDVTVTIN